MLNRSTYFHFRNNIKCKLNLAMTGVAQDKGRIKLLLQGNLMRFPAHKHRVAESMLSDVRKYDALAGNRS